MKLYLDHNFPLQAAWRLRDRGHDALTARDAALAEASDAEQLLFALGEGRVLVTKDTDFIVIQEAWSCWRPQIRGIAHHAGILLMEDREAQVLVPPLQTFLETAHRLVDELPLET